MADTPLINQEELFQQSQFNPRQEFDSLPLVPFTNPYSISTLQSYENEDALSQLSASIIPSGGGNGSLQGGSVYRPLSELQSDRFPFLLPGADNEDIYGSGQGILSKSFNGITKGLGLAATTFINGTAGLVYGTFKALEDGKFSSFYNNELTRSMDEFNKNMENWFPNYYSAIESNADWYSPSNLLTANFLFDKLIKNSGFAVGAIASGVAWSSAFRAIGLTQKLMQAGQSLQPNQLLQLEQAVAAAPKAERVAIWLNGLEELTTGQRIVSTIGKGLQQSDRALTALFATTGEAGMEALQATNEYRDRLIQEYKNNHFGNAPTGVELQAINESADKVGNTAFGLNTALLTATNYIQFPKILGSTYKGERTLLNREINSLVQNGEGQFVRATPTTKFGKFFNENKFGKGLKTFSKLFSKSEGFEEGAQYAIQTGTQNYYDKAYRNKETSWLDDLVGEGIRQTFNSKEGMEGILLGSLTGGIMQSGVISTYRNEQGKTRVGFGKSGWIAEGREREKNTTEALSDLNQARFSRYLRDQRDGANRAEAIQEDRTAAIRQGDILESKDLETDYQINYLQSRIKWGKFDAVQNDINKYRQLISTPEGIQQLQAEGIITETDTQESVAARLNALEQTAKSVKLSYETLYEKYAGVLNEDGSRRYSDAIIDKLVYSSAKIQDYNSRILNLNNSLGVAGVQTTEAINELLGNTNNTLSEYIPSVETGDRKTSALTEALRTIENSNLSEEEKEDKIDELRDLMELSLRQKAFRDEYSHIKGNPERYSDEREQKRKTLLGEINQISSPEEAEAFQQANPDLDNGDVFLAALDESIAANREYLPSEIALIRQKIGQQNSYKEQYEAAKEQFSNLVRGEKVQEKFIYLLNAENMDELNSAFQKLSKKDRAIFQPFYDAASSYFSIKGKSINDYIQEQKRKTATVTQRLEEDRENDIIPTTPEQEDKELEFSSSKTKSADHLFFSTTAISERSSELASPAAKRMRSFLNNAHNLSPAKRDSLRTILISANQEEALGLKGITALSANNNQAILDKITDENEGIILALVVDDKNNLIDENGDVIAPLGQVVDINRIVFGTMPTTSLTWSEEWGGKARYRQEEEQEAKSNQQVWLNERKKIFAASAEEVSSTNNAISFSISNGISKKTELPDGTYQHYPILGSIISQEDLRDAQILRVVQGTEENLSLAKGRAYIRKGEFIQPVSTNFFSEKKASTLADALQLYARQINEGEEINPLLTTYIKALLYWPKGVASKTSPNTVFTSTTNGVTSLVIGNQLTIPFTEQAINQNKNAVITALQNIKHNVNNKMLLEATPKFFEITDVNPDTGDITTTTYPTYRHYLLSSEEDSPLYTLVRPINPNVENDYNYEQKYLILNSRPEQAVSVGITRNNVQAPPTTGGYDIMAASYIMGGVGTNFSTDYFIQGLAGLFERAAPSIEAIRRKNANADMGNLKNILNTPLYNSIFGEIRAAIVGMYNSEKAGDLFDQIMSFPTGLPVKLGEQISSEIEALNAPTISMENIVTDGVTMNSISIEGNELRFTATFNPTTNRIEVVKLDARSVAAALGTSGLSEAQANEAAITVIEATVNQTVSAIQTPIVQTPVVEGFSSLPVLDGVTVNEATFNGITIEFTADSSLNVSISDRALATTFSNLTFEGAPIPENVAREISVQAITELLQKQFSSTNTNEENTTFEEPIPTSPVDITPRQSPSVPIQVREIDLSGMDDAPFRIANGPFQKMQKGDVEQFKKYLAEVAPNLPFEILEQMLTTNDGRQAFGEFRNGVIRFYREGMRGTEYHELGEAIWNSFLTNEEKEKIYSEFRNREGKYKDRESGKIISFSEATPHQIKEKVLDEFADYRVSKLPARSLTEWIVKLWERIKEFFSFFNSPTAVQDLFNRIDNGEFAFRTDFNTMASEYRAVEGLTEQQTHDIVQDMVAKSVAYVLQNAKSLFAIEESRITEEQIFKSLEPFYLERVGGERVWNQLKTKTKQWLRTLRVEFDEEGNTTTSEEEKNRNEYASGAFTMDVKKSSPAIIRLLLASLIKTENNGVAFSWPTPVQSKGAKGNILLDYSRTFAILLNELVSSPNIDIMMRKLINLSGENQDFIRLANRLGVQVRDQKLMKEIVHGLLDDDGKGDKWKLLVQFYQTFAKQNPIVQTWRQEDGKFYVVELSNAEGDKTLIDEWIANAAYSGMGWVKKSENGWKVDGTITKAPTTNIAEKTAFLNKLAIPITLDQMRQIQNSPRDAERMSTAINKIKEFISKKQLTSVTRRTLGIETQLRTIARIVNTLNKSQKETAYFFDGERMNSWDNHNAISQFQSWMNNVSSIEDLYAALPYLRDVFSANSRILKLGGDFFDENGKRTETPFQIANFKGITNIDTGKETSITKLLLSARHTTTINQATEGYYNVLIPADSSTSWQIKMGNHFSYSDFNNPQYIKEELFNLFSGYLKDEIALARENRSYNQNVAKNGAASLRFFADIISPQMQESINTLIQNGENINEFIETNKEALTEQFYSWSEQHRDNESAVLIKDGIVQKDNGINYSFKSLSSDFSDAESVKVNSGSMTERQYNNFVHFYSLNTAIANIEMHKIMFGDPFQFKISSKEGVTILDENKRIKSFLSPRKSTFDHPAYNSFLNIYNNIPRDENGEFLKDKEGNLIHLTENDRGYHNHKPYLNTITVPDVNSVSPIALEGSDTNISEPTSANYESSNEADAQSYIPIWVSRESGLKNGNWTKGDEAFFHWDMANWRLHMDEYSNPALKAHDEKMSKMYSPASFTPLKPITTGSLYGEEKINTNLIKTSEAHIPFVEAVKHPNLFKLMEKMFKEKVDTLTTASAHKVGIQKLHPIYSLNDKGTFSFNEESFPTPLRIPHTARGIQVETQETHNDQTIGSQLTKLAFLDLFNNGEVNNENPIAQKEIIQKYNNYIQALENIYANGFSNFQKKLGMESTVDGLKFNKVKLAAFLESEIGRRGLPDNIREALQINEETGDFITLIEATPAYSSVQKILFSFIEKQITRQKVSGGPKVQISSLLFESKDRKAVYRPSKGAKYQYVTDLSSLNEEQKKSIAIVSTDLKFYSTNKDGSLNAMEVYLPHWFKKQIASSKKLSKMDDASLLSYLNSTEEGRKILTGIGFRIPTQGLNSVEYFTVKGFLHESMGDSIVVPSEITTKAGSDFDIDKLNTYLRNTYIDSNGDLKLVPIVSLEESDNFFANLFNDMLADEIERMEKSIQSTANLFGVTQDIVFGLADTATVDKWKPIIRRMIGDAEDTVEFENSLMISLEKKGKRMEKMNNSDIQEVLMEKFIERMKRQSLENSFYDALESLITLPQNVDRMLTPNSNGQYEDLAKANDILQAKVDNPNNDKAQKAARSETIGKLLSPSYQVRTIQTFLTAKYWVGAAAVNNVAHSLFQLGNIKVDNNALLASTKAKISSMFENYGNRRIVLPTNSSLSQVRDFEGKYISDTFSAFLNAVVDVAKDPFIMRVIYHQEVMSVHMALTHMGVPVKTQALFFQQPVIKSYLKLLDEEGKRGVQPKLAQYAIDLIAKGKSVGKNTMDEDDMAFSNRRFSRSLNKFNRELETMVLNQNKLGASELSRQAQIMTEFIKYQILGDNITKASQALTWDTQRFSSGVSVARKNFMSDTAFEKNLFIGLETVFNTSFLKTARDYVNQSQDLMGNILKLEQPIIREKLNKILNPYISNNFMSNNDREKIGQKLINSYLSYLINRVDSPVMSILTSESEAAAFRIKEAQAQFPDSILSEINVVNQKGAFTISIRRADRDNYTSNRLTGMLREFKQLSPSLYNDIITLALVQGTQSSPISFYSLIPIEDYTERVRPILNLIDNEGELDNFASNYYFEKNNWNDDKIVPSPKFPKVEKDALYLEVGEWNKGNSIIKIPLWKYTKLTNQMGEEYWGYRNQLTGKTMNSATRNKMREEGDFSYRDILGYQLVTNPDGTPATIRKVMSGQRKEVYVYKPTNLLGATSAAFEVTEGVSAFNNGTIKVVSAEIDENDYSPFFTNTILSEQEWLEVNAREEMQLLQQEIATLQAELAEQQERMMVAQEAFNPYKELADAIPRISIESAKREIGRNMKIGNKQDISPFLVTKEGPSIEEAAEQVHEVLTQRDINTFDVQDIRNEIISYLTMGRKAYLESNSISPEMRSIQETLESKKDDLRKAALSTISLGETQQQGIQFSFFQMDEETIDDVITRMSENGDIQFKCK